MEILGYALALLIGLSLGLIGGGGSILALPVLVYLLNVPELEATSYSFFVVGLSAWVGTIQKSKDRLIDFRTALIFGIPSILSVYFARFFLLPLIPESFNIADFSFQKGNALMIFFSFIMIAAGLSSVSSKRESSKSAVFSGFSLVIAGFLEGLLTGTVGAGGGFLIIPLLHRFGKLEIKKAMATSLLIIAVKSTLGFSGDLTRFSPNWFILLPFSAMAIGGIFLGNYIAKKVSSSSLKKGFGWFLIALGFLIFAKELFMK
jgi:uncharacterized membrane protein YfcA